MNTSDPLHEGAFSSQANQPQEVKDAVLPQEAAANPQGMAVTPGSGTWKSEGVLSALEKALNELFKAQDHLNTAADHGGESLSKMIDGINRNLRGLQREVSQVIYRLGKSG